MIYLDNGATTWPKPRGVSESMTDCLVNYCANPGRSSHEMALKSEEIVFDCRCKICSLFGLDNPSDVIFTHNATHALNIVIKGILSSDSHAVATSMEHNSVLRPLKSTGARYDIAWADSDGYVSACDVEKLIKPDTSLIICTLSSNVCGSVQPFIEIAKIASKYGIPFLLDASQGAGSIDIDMSALGIDYLAAPGHKGLLGPMGTGVLCINNHNTLKTLTEGGTGSQSKLLGQPTELPDRFESGTLNVVGIAGLSAGLDYVLSRKPQNILKHELSLIGQLADKLSRIPGIHLAGYNPHRKRTAVLSFTAEGIDSMILAAKLSMDYGIAVRSGFHCAYMAHRTLGTESTGTVRVCTGPFTTESDIDRLLYAVNEITLQHRQNRV